ncbi:UNVERIFIED_ORG: hypothetical protein GGI57_000344 [Rhizobium aethiopicum]|uniref:DUF4345 domain-containing protein n=1 Tax=Rhizobium acidisoli TaxID=1538158 RepID=A0AAE5TZC0_9HYPH|nr:MULTISPECIES: hypothetical protein [Rhizobium]KPH09301.1 hypothetical protein AOG23_08500 [Rhizobium acidisoli]OHV18479.1 DUF4345 domain-containing protein [Rhizobium sp. RSm-3]QAS79979.1 DUF4345 domain-containing protein [Rhizobium acidisoli]RVU09211.1 DUF4345 domain-containing protein [Rhizobium sp. RMa-01]
MEFEFPTEFGEQLAFGAAAFTAFAGFVIMFAPGLAMRVFGLAPRGERREGFSEVRSMGGFYLGLGLGAVMLAQTLIYTVFGAAFAMAAFARIVSILSDKGSTYLNYLLLVVQAIIAALPLLYVFGFFQT